MHKKYTMSIYAVYVGNDYSVKLFEYPARKRNSNCIECKVYLNKSSPKSGMIKLPTNEFFKTDFGKTVVLANCSVTYYQDKNEAINAARSNILRQHKKTRNDINSIKAQILEMQERLVELQEIEAAYISGEFNSTPVKSDGRNNSYY